jgi:hypothetical protein
MISYQRGVKKLYSSQFDWYSEPNPILLNLFLVNPSFPLSLCVLFGSVGHPWWLVMISLLGIRGRLALPNCNHMSSEPTTTFLFGTFLFSLSRSRFCGHLPFTFC